jgi:enoyl-CoA hydratase/carnithine racemase
MSGIAVAQQGGVVTIRLDRPDKHNALRPVDWAAIGEAVVAAGRNPAARAILIAGAGDHFSAGFDLKSAPAPGEPPTVRGVNRTVLEIYRSPKPVVAAVEGCCIGASWSLALACDMLVAGETAFFQPPLASRGLVFDAGIAWFLAQRLSRFEIARLYTLDLRLTAPAALAAGLVGEVVPAGAAVARGQALAERLAALPAMTLAIAKAALQRSIDGSLESVLAEEEIAVSLNGGDAEAQAVRHGFVARLGGKG